MVTSILMLLAWVSATIHIRAKYHGLCFTNRCCECGCSFPLSSPALSCTLFYHPSLGELKQPVLFYIVVILTMVWLAWGDRFNGVDRFEADGGLFQLDKPLIKKEQE